MQKSTKFSPEIRERAVRMVLEHQGEHESQWATIRAMAAKMGCTAETPRRWLRQHEWDTGVRHGVTTAERDRIKALDRKVQEPEIPRQASAYFAHGECGHGFGP